MEPSTEDRKQQETKPASKTPEGTPQDKAELSDLADRLREMEGIEDNVAQMIADNWQRVLGGLVVIVLVTMLIQRMRDERVADVGNASTVYSTALVHYDSAKVIDDGAGKEKELVQFREALAELQEQYSGSSYAALAGVQAALIAIEAGNYAEARQALAVYDVEQFRGVTTVRIPQERPSVTELANELAALLSAKVAVLEAGDDREKLAPAISLLKGIALGASVVNVQAWYSLALLSAEDDALRAEVVQMANDILLARPESGTIIREQADALGIRVLG